MEAYSKLTGSSGRTIRKYVFDKDTTDRRSTPSCHIHLTTDDADAEAFCWVPKDLNAPLRAPITQKSRRRQGGSRGCVVVVVGSHVNVTVRG